MARKIKVSGTVSLSTSIILMVIGAFLIKYSSAVIEHLIFLIAVSAAVFGLALIVRKLRYKREDNELYLGLALLVLGVLAAIFTSEISKYGLVVIGALFVVFGLIIIINNARRSSWFYMGLGVARLIIGTALIVLAFTSASDVQNTFALITGIVALSLGLTFLLLEK